MVSGYGDAGFRLDDRRPVEHGRRAPDRRTLLRVYVGLRLTQLHRNMDGMRIGNETDARRYATMEAQEAELRQLCIAVGLDPDTLRWVPVEHPSD